MGLVSLLLLFSLMACGAPKYSSVSSGLRNQLLQDFENGKLVLDCEMECYWSHLQSRKMQHQLFLGGRYEDLAVSVMQVGMEIDLSYFYLGYAAEKLGYHSAAEAYYQRSLALSQSRLSYNKCEDLFCNGIKLPLELPERLEAVRRLKRQQSQSLLAAKAKDETVIVYAPTFNKEILLAEQALSTAGYDTGNVDGIDDSRFRNALRRCQKDNELAETGELNEASRKVLGLKPAKTGGEGKKKSREKKEQGASAPVKEDAAASPSEGNGKKENAVVLPAEHGKTEGSESKNLKKESDSAPAKMPEKTPPSTNDQAFLTESTDLVAEPSVMAESLGEIRRGAKVDVLTIQGNFTKIRHNGKEGFIHSNFIKKDQ